MMGLFSRITTTLPSLPGAAVQDTVKEVGLTGAETTIFVGLLEGGLMVFVPTTPYAAKYIVGVLGVNVDSSMPTCIATPCKSGRLFVCSGVQVTPSALSDITKVSQVRWTCR